MSADEEWAFFAGMAANNRELEQLKPAHAETVREYYRRQGRNSVRDRVNLWIIQNQCFDFQKAEVDKTQITCEHQACHVLRNLRNLLIDEMENPNNVR
jgi:hypothetical protein